MQSAHFIRTLCIISILFLLSSLNARDLIIKDRLSNTTLGSLRSIDLGRHTFIPIERFAEILSISTDKSLLHKTISLNYKQNQILFTAHSPFVLFGQQKFQMQANVRFPNRDFYVPLDGFIDGLNVSGINTVEFDPSENALYILTRSANIVRLSTITQNDTVKLILHTTHPFKNSDLSTEIEDEWLFINIDGGIVDVRNDLGMKDVEEIFDFIPLQVNKDQCRFSLYLAPNVSEATVIASESANEIIINLTKQSLASSSVLADLQREREKWKIDTIILDPGHGGRDPGCVGTGRIYEKDIVLGIAKATQSELERRMNANVILTRDHDSFVALKGRTKKANEQGGKLFVSFHVDANRVKSLHGHTVYFLGPAKTDDARDVAQFENSVIKFEESQNAYAGLSDMSFILAANAQNSYNKESQDFASIIDEEIKNQCGSRSHGVRQAGFYVLYGASMPNILIETGFMTNSNDRNKLTSSSYQNSLAKAVTDGIIKFTEKYESLNF